VVRRIETAVTASFKRRESESATAATVLRKDLELKADEMLESQARRACDLASTRAEGAAKQAIEAARKCGETAEARDRSEAAAAKAEAAAAEAKEAKAWLTHQVTGFVRATEEGITALKDQGDRSDGRLTAKVEEGEARVRAAVAEADDWCR